MFSSRRTAVPAAVPVWCPRIPTAAAVSVSVQASLPGIVRVSRKRFFYDTLETRTAEAPRAARGRTRCYHRSTVRGFWIQAINLPIFLLLSLWMGVSSLFVFRGSVCTGSLASDVLTASLPEPPPPSRERSLPCFPVSSNFHPAEQAALQRRAAIDRSITPRHPLLQHLHFRGYSVHSPYVGGEYSLTK